MTAEPGEFAAGSTVSCTSQHNFTSCKEMNDMLNQYVRQAEREQIWMTIDSSGFYKKHLDEYFCKLLEQAIIQAFNSCRKAAPPHDRHIKIRSMEQQHKIFVKIIYSCEEEERDDVLKCFARIGNRLEREEGYFKVQDEDTEQVMMIAIPIAG